MGLDALSFYDTDGDTLHIDTNILANSNFEKLQQRLKNSQILCRNCATISPIERAKSTTNHSNILKNIRMIAPDEFAIGLNILTKNGRDVVVLGVSGGIDSIVMLDLFTKIYLKENLIVAHVNHSLRAESDEDERFVKSIAKKYKIKFVSKKLDPHKSGNLEEYFRDERRKFLLSVVKKYSADFLALAHNADDQAETVLMNLARGSGPAGLSGMKDSDEQIIRPILHYSRAEILEYAKEHKLAWREDKTNRDISYSRNYIRHQILPLLARLNPEYLANIGRSSKIQREIDDYLKAKASFLTRQLHENSLVSKEIPQPVLYEAFGLMYEQVRGDRKDLSITHLAAIERLAGDAAGTKELELPGGIVARRQYNHLDFVLKMRDNIAPVPPSSSLSLGNHAFGDWEIKISEYDMPVTSTINDKWTIAVESLTDLQLRTVEPGDKIQKRGMEGRKKLQDLFVDAKIDRTKRQNYPILASKSVGEVLWVPGLAISKKLVPNKAKYNITVSKER